MSITSDQLASYGIAFLFAALIHVVVIGLMSLSWDDQSRSIDEIAPYYIDARVVSENPFTAGAKREKSRELSQRDQKLVKRRAHEAKLQKDTADWEKSRRDRKAPLAALDSEPVVRPQVIAPPVVPTRSVAPEKSRDEMVQGLELAIIEEQGLRRAVTADEKAMAYVAQIQRDIVQYWSRPPSARNGMESLLRVSLIPTGEVIDVKLEQSSGNDAFDRSAIQAVRKARRFTVPSDTLRFERDFREFTVLFKPDDLRL